METLQAIGRRRCRRETLDVVCLSAAVGQGAVGNVTQEAVGNVTQEAVGNVTQEAVGNVTQEAVGNVAQLRRLDCDPLQGEAGPPWPRSPPP